MLADLAAATPQRFAALGIDLPRSLAEATIPLYQASAKAKFHWAHRRSRCKHMPGFRQWYSPNEKRPAPWVTDRSPALGFSESIGSICMSCARAVSISAPADAFVAVAAELFRGLDWLEDGRRSADEAWTWLQFARWKARQPLTGRVWDERLRAVKGKDWTEAVAGLRSALGAYRDEVKVVAECVADSIGENPGISAVLERAVLMVETESAVLQESAAVLKISGCGVAQDAYTRMFSPASTYKQAEPWRVVAGIWRHALKSGSPTGSDLAAIAAAYLDDEFPHVHDLASLPTCALHEPTVEPGDSVHSWALRIAQDHRRVLIRDWIARLDMAAAGLLDSHLDASNECTHLICIPWWPLTGDGMEAIAYLSQFEVIGGPVAVERRPFGFEEKVAVVRAPAWAAAHTAELRTPLRSEPITDQRRQSVKMLRQHGVALVEGEFVARRKPSSVVEEARALRDNASAANPYWYEHSRPLRPGAVPPRPYADEPWSWFAVRCALERAHFVYGVDDYELLSIGFPAGGGRSMEARLEVECRSFDGAGWCVEEIDGTVESVQANGSLEFTPDGMHDSVTVPAAYVVGLAFR
ncbi:hypothetical protein [Mycolicibacterium alvei]|nr:hypothetical protein [Mycolicibacterium alvei]MCV7003506.1 hypothetical protein [Mycolicibacterium alvei]